MCFTASSFFLWFLFSCARMFFQNYLMQLTFFLYLNTIFFPKANFIQKYKNWKNNIYAAETDRLSICICSKILNYVVIILKWSQNLIILTILPLTIVVIWLFGCVVHTIIDWHLDRLCINEILTIYRVVK